jgi:hypothetical protein
MNKHFFKMFFISLSLFLIPICTWAATSDTPPLPPYLSPKETSRYPVLARFVEQHALPKDYRAIFAHFAQTEGGKLCLQKKTCKVQGLPFYTKKDDIIRILNAQQMKTCFQKLRLHHLDVTNKYIGKSDKGWIVFSQEVEGHPLTKLTPPPVQFNKEIAEQLYTLAQETGFCDWGHAAPNWILRHSDNCLVCIDTDVDAFSESLFESVDELCSSWKPFFTKEAFAYLKEKKNKLRSKEVADSKPPFESYDNPALPFTEIMQEFHDLTCQTLEESLHEPSKKYQREE